MEKFKSNEVFSPDNSLKEILVDKGRLKTEIERLTENVQSGSKEEREILDKYWIKHGIDPEIVKTKLKESETDSFLLGAEGKNIEDILNEDQIPGLSYKDRIYSYFLGFSPEDKEDHALSGVEFFGINDEVIRRLFEKYRDSTDKEKKDVLDEILNSPLLDFAAAGEFVSWNPRESKIIDKAVGLCKSESDFAKLLLISKRYIPEIRNDLDARILKAFDDFKKLKKLGITSY